MFDFTKVQYSDCENDKFAIESFELTESQIRMIELRDRMHGGYESHGILPGKYARLVEKKSWIRETVMSNTPMETETNKDVISEARGDVLIAGLGMGLVVLGIQDKPEVTSITIIEKHQEVIELVKPQLALNSKVNIIVNDIFDFKTTNKYDTIYFDIWNNICTDEWEGIKKLKRTFRKNLNKNGWMGVWRNNDFKYGLR